MESATRSSSVPIVGSLIRRFRRRNLRLHAAPHVRSVRVHTPALDPIPDVPGADMDARIEALFGRHEGGKKHGQEREYWSTSPDRARALRLCVGQLPRSDGFRQRFETELGGSRGPMPVCTAALRALDQNVPSPFTRLSAGVYFPYTTWVPDLVDRGIMTTRESVALKRVLGVIAPALNQWLSIGTPAARQQLRVVINPYVEFLGMALGLPEGMRLCKRVLDGLTRLSVEVGRDLHATVTPWVPINEAHAREREEAWDALPTKGREGHLRHLISARLPALERQDGLYERFDRWRLEPQREGCPFVAEGKAFGGSVELQLRTGSEVWLVLSSDRQRSRARRALKQAPSQFRAAQRARLTELHGRPTITMRCSDTAMAFLASNLEG